MLLTLELLVLLIACLASLVGIWSSPKRNKKVVVIATVIAVAGLGAAATLTIRKSRDAVRKAVETETQRQDADKQIKGLQTDFSDYSKSAEEQLAGLRSDNEDLRNRIAESQQKAQEQSELALKGIEEFKIKGGAVVTRLLTKDHVADYVNLIFDLSKILTNEQDSERKEKVFPLVGTEGLSASKAIIDVWVTKRLRQRITISHGDFWLLVEMSGGPKYQVGTGGDALPAEPAKAESDEGQASAQGGNLEIDDKFSKSIRERPNFWHEFVVPDYSFGVDFLGHVDKGKRPTMAMPDALRALTKSTTIGSLQISFDEQPKPEQVHQLEQLWRKYISLYVKIYLADRGFVEPEKKDEGEDTQWTNMRPHMFIPVQFGQFVLRNDVLTVDLTVSGEPQLFFQEEYPF
jgi:TolA-binding protein